MIPQKCGGLSLRRIQLADGLVVEGFGGCAYENAFLGQLRLLPLMFISLLLQVSKKHGKRRFVKPFEDEFPCERTQHLTVFQNRLNLRILFLILDLKLFQESAPLLGLSQE